MNTFSRSMHCDGCTDRLTYQRNVALLAFGKSAIDLMSISLLPHTDPATVAMAWLNPFVLVRPWIEGDMPFAICGSTFAFFVALVWNSVHRARNAGWNHWLALATAVPFTNVVMALLLAWIPAKKRSVWDLV